MEASVAPTEPLIAMTFHLTPAEQQTLQELARRRGVSPNQAFREAIAEKKFFSDQRRQGNVVSLKYPNGRFSDLTWPDDQ